MGDRVTAFPLSTVLRARVCTGYMESGVTGVTRAEKPDFDACN
jgi:hypothetical protein